MVLKRQLVIGLLFCCLASVCRPAGGQELCRGDVNGDNIVSTADAVIVPYVVFDSGDFDPDTSLRADGNDDGVVSAADVVAILLLNGMPCPVTPTPTPTISPTVTVVQSPPSPTPTPTMTPTPTHTATPSPTPTPTPTCVVRTLSLGTTNGELTSGDCLRAFSGDELRYTDAYSIVGTPGQAITIDVAATAASGPISPYVAIIDADGQFELAQSAPPIEFVVTTTQPYLVYVTSAPMTPIQLGTYQVTASARVCPTPIALTPPAQPNGNLGATECPDPAGPATAGAPNPVDTYTFTVTATQVPTNLQILMRQTNYNDDIDPVFSVIGPDGYELFSPDLDDNEAAPPQALRTTTQRRTPAPAFWRPCPGNTR